MLLAPSDDSGPVRFDTHGPEATGGRARTRRDTHSARRNWCGSTLPSSTRGRHRGYVCGRLGAAADRPRAPIAAHRPAGHRAPALSDAADNQALRVAAVRSGGASVDRGEAPDARAGPGRRPPVRALWPEFGGGDGGALRGPGRAPRGAGVRARRGCGALRPRAGRWPVLVLVPDGSHRGGARLPACGARRGRGGPPRPRTATVRARDGRRRIVDLSHREQAGRVRRRAGVRRRVGGGR
ncbi:hypothetical protein C8K38_11674 [Rhodococcus sp. OK611]|nr:hypothetical protein C8K38_11674 [Rhodococcus sp. OK611]SNX92812.1 hypothetical protein SAMN05447004_11674 [Rhodococcus sp. OK270]